MGKENGERNNSRTFGHRKKLSDITNTPILLKSRLHDENDEFAHKDTLAQMQEELVVLKKMLSEKETILADSKRCMEKLCCSYFRKSKQNDEIILHNSELHRDLMQVRDQLKILQHENAQMSAVYKACKAEMQEKLNTALEQVDQLTKVLQSSSTQQAADRHCPGQTFSCRFLCDQDSDDSNTIASKCLLKKKHRKCYKQPSLKAKMSLNAQISNHENKSTHNTVYELSSELRGSKGTEVSTAELIFCKSLETNKCYPREEKEHEEEDQNLAISKCLSKEKGWNIAKSALPTATTGFAIRPQRRAASSIGSYKEPPLNTKLRRAC